MNRYPVLFAASMLLVGLTARAADHVSTGAGLGTVQDKYRSSCGEYHFNADGTYEFGYAWENRGVVAPDFGAFAERYELVSQYPCAVILDLTQVGTQAGETMDLYTWDELQGRPAAVLGVTVGFDPGPVAVWPEVSRHVGRIPTNCSDSGVTWIGYWGNWPGERAGWYIGADLDGPGGYPFTNIVQGLGYPSGWNHVSVVWGLTQALGIGAEFTECFMPVQKSSWGEIKSLYK